MSVSDIDRQCPRGLNQSVINDYQWQTTPFDDKCLQVCFIYIYFINYYLKFFKLF